MQQVLRKALLLSLAAAVAVGSVTALASAGPGNRPALTVISPSPTDGATLTSDTVSFAFTYNRKPDETRTLTCSLSGPTSSTGACETPTALGKKDSQSGKSYSGLANGSYTFTASLTLTDGGTASATRQFTVNVPLPPPPGHIYWGQSTDSVGRADMAGQNVNQGFIFGGNFLTDVAVDDSHVYWVNSGPCCAANSQSIGRADLDGQNVNQNFITGIDRPFDIEVDDGHVYWGSLSNQRIGRADIDGQNVNQNFITGIGFVNDVAVDSSHVYWSTGLWIGRADLDGQNVDANLISGVNISGLAVDSTHLYWGVSINTANAIVRADLDGQNPNSSFITNTNGGPKELAVDNSHLYWASTENTIGRADLDGQNVNPTFISPTSVSVRGVAVSTG